MAEAVFKWVKDGDVMVAVNSAGNLGDELWSSFMEDFGSADFRIYIGASLGILEVNSSQRKDAARAIKQTGIRVVIVTNDMLVRGIVTAVSWLGANAKSFAWKDFDRALDRHGLHERRVQIMAHVERLREEVLAEVEDRKRERREMYKTNDGA
jgi:hypothetical protein